MMQPTAECRAITHGANENGDGAPESQIAAAHDRQITPSARMAFAAWTRPAVLAPST